MTDLAAMFGQAAVPMEDGTFMSASTVRIAELIAEYDPSLEVRWIPPNQRAFNEPAFAIVSRQMNGAEYVVFYVQSEADMDHRVLARLIENDSTKQGNVLSKLDAANLAIKIEAERKKEDEEMERLEVAQSILRSPKATYKHNGRTYE